MFSDGRALHYHQMLSTVMYICSDKLAPGFTEIRFTCKLLSTPRVYEPQGGRCLDEHYLGNHLP